MRRLELLVIRHPSLLHYTFSKSYICFAIDYKVVFTDYREGGVGRGYNSSFTSSN